MVAGDARRKQSENALERLEVIAAADVRPRK